MNSVPTKNLLTDNCKLYSQRKSYYTDAVGSDLGPSFQLPKNSSVEVSHVRRADVQERVDSLNKQSKLFLVSSELVSMS